MQGWDSFDNRNMQKVIKVYVGAAASGGYKQTASQMRTERRRGPRLAGDLSNHLKAFLASSLNSQLPTSQILCNT